jgi:hypothetical protein
MMTVDPKERISADDALESAWMNASNSELSSDLTENLDELKIELAVKFKGAVRTIMATNKIQKIMKGS